jgi:hypothetical protein
VEIEGSMSFGGITKDKTSLSRESVVEMSKNSLGRHHIRAHN